MNPIKFPEALAVFGDEQKEYLPLPAFRHLDDWKCISSCWGLSFIERIKLFFTGKVWVTMPTFGQPVSHIKLSVNKPNFE